MLKVPLKKLNRNLKTVIFFWILILLGVAISVLFILPPLDNLVIIIIYGAIHLCIFINFMFGMCLGPGYLEPNPGYDFQDLLNKLDPVYLCPDCKVIRTPRSRH